ncbi:hypothetical protein [Roseivirga sp.]|uniref:hypothetical protein n=1 Tax=Roseivirga sp. TaxID=1964215 RepID=UPI003B8AA854
MEGERDNIDQFFQDRFSSFEKPPSKSVWAGIQKHGLMANGAKLIYLGNYGYLILIIIVASGLITLGVGKNKLFNLSEQETVISDVYKKQNKNSEIAGIKKEEDNTDLEYKSSQKPKEETSGNSKSDDLRINDSTPKTTSRATEKHYSGASLTQKNGSAIGKESGLTSDDNQKSNVDLIKTRPTNTANLVTENSNEQSNEEPQSYASPKDAFTAKNADNVENETAGSSLGDLSMTDEVMTDQPDDILTNGHRGPLPIVKSRIRSDIDFSSTLTDPEINGDIRLQKTSLSIARGMDIANERFVNDSLKYRSWGLSILQSYETTVGSQVSMDVVYYLSQRAFLEAGAGLANQFNNDFRLSYNYTFGQMRFKPYATVQVNGSGLFSDNSITAGIGLLFDVRPEGRWRIFATAVPTSISRFDSFTFRAGVQYRFTPPSKYEYALPESEYTWFFSTAYLGRFSNSSNVGGLPAVEVQMGKFIGKRTFLNTSLNTELVVGAKLEHYLLSNKRLDLGLGLGIIADIKGSLSFDPLPEVIGYYKISSHWKFFGRYSLRREESQIMPEHLAIGFQRGILRRKE